MVSCERDLALATDLHLGGGAAMTFSNSMYMLWMLCRSVLVIVPATAVVVP